jgi:hypothetical protein
MDILPILPAETFKICAESACNLVLSQLAITIRPATKDRLPNMGRSRSLNPLWGIAMTDLEQLARETAGQIRARIFEP